MKMSFAELKAYNSYTDWYKNDRRIAEKIEKLIEDIVRHPTEGLGKPEALKGNLDGFYSRRISQEHRLVYKIEGDNIIITSCRGHYAA
jgi:toxin YoeB